MNNVEFRYLYRDGGNYKKTGSVIFFNPKRLTSASIDRDLRRLFLTDGLFIAGQIRVPEVFLYAGGKFSFDDHCYHELDEVKSSDEAANDTLGRSISQFLVEVTSEAERGWREFDPYDSEGSLGWFLATRVS